MKAPVALVVALLGVALMSAGCGGASDEPAVVDRVTIDESPPSAVAEPVQRDGASAALDGLEPDRSATGVLEAPPDDASVGGGWERVVLGAAPIDSGSSVVSSADATVVLSGTDDGALESWISTDGSSYEQTTGSPAAGGFTTLMAAAVRDDIWLAVGTDYEKFLPIVWISSDGRAWQRAETAGLERHGDMNSVVATERGFVATGAYRTGADLGSGPFVPALWRSVDGLAWEEIDLPSKRMGFALGVVAIGDRLLVAGGSGPSAVVWSSDDQGSSWSRTRPKPLREAGPSHITSMAVAADGESVVLVGGSFDEGRGGAPLVLVSDDRGESWESVSLDAALWDGVFGGGVVNATAHGLVFVGHRSFGPFTDADRCYADPEVCGSSTGVALHSVDGRTWGELDLSGCRSRRLLPGAQLRARPPRILASARCAGPARAQPLDSAPPAADLAAAGAASDLGHSACDTPDSARTRHHLPLPT